MRRIPRVSSPTPTRRPVAKSVWRPTRAIALAALLTLAAGCGGDDDSAPQSGEPDTNAGDATGAADAAAFPVDVEAANGTVTIEAEPVRIVSLSPTATEMRRLGVTSAELRGATFMAGQGCAQCRFTGYRGRICVFELLVLNELVKDAILNRRTSYEIRRVSIETSGLVALLDPGAPRHPQAHRRRGPRAQGRARETPLARGRQDAGRRRRRDRARRADFSVLCR